MSMVNLSLDDIIAKNRANKKGRGQDSSFKSDSISGKRSSNTGGRRTRGGGSFANTRSVPAGRWRNDKFSNEEAGSGRGAVLSTIAVNKKVRVNLSNLAVTVMSADLEELFANYNIDSATVHYGEGGQPLGTGDVILRKKDALRIVQDFKGVSVDGQRLVMVIVDGEASGTASVFDRVQVSDRSGPRRVSGGGIQKRSSGGPSGGRRSGGGRHPLDRFEDSAPRGASGGRGGRRGGKQPKKPKTEAELDAELDAYMKKDSTME